MKNTKKTLGFDADFDTFWKEALNLIELATLFFLPNLHREVDWSIHYKPLEQELRSLFRGRKGRIKRTDKLFRLQLKDGSDRVVFFHIEAEAFPDKNFPKRMLEYYMLLCLKFGFIPITLLAIFVGDKPKSRLNGIKLEFYGTHSEIRYNTYSIAEQSEQNLLSDQNPFAILVLANLYVIQSRQEPERRMLQKRKLVEQLHRREMRFDLFHQLLNFATFLVQLPDELSSEFEDYYNKTYKNKEDMTGKERFIAHEKKMTGLLLKNLYGKTFEEAEQEAMAKVAEIQNKVNEAERRALEAQNKAAEAQNKAAEAQNKAAEAQAEAQKKATEAQAEAQKKAAEAQAEAQKKTDELLRKSVLNLYEKLGLSPEQIANTLEIEIDLVRRVLSQ